METVHALLSLPVDILKGQLLPLFAPRDLQRLDEACCSADSRSSFHATIRDAVVVNQYAVAIGRVMSQWIRKRQCFFSYVVITHRTELPHINGTVHHSLIATISYADPSVTRRFLIRGSKLSTVYVGSAGAFHHLPSSVKRLQVDWNVECFDEDVEILAQRCPNLEKLVLQASNELTPESFKSIAKYCACLQELHLSGGIEDSGLMALGAGCPQLRVFNIGSGWVTDAGMEAFAWGCPRLTMFVMTEGGHFTDTTLCALAAHCPDVQHLDLGDNHTFTDSGVIALAQGCTKLQKMSFFDQTLTDAAYAAIATNCPELRELDCQKCPLLGSATLQALGKHCPALQMLRISGANLVIDAGLLGLGPGCPALEELDLAGSRLITGTGVAALANCTALRNITLDHCLNITDEGICAIAEKCVALRNLSVRNCALLTAASTLAIAQHCRYLEYINREGCTGLTQEALLALQMALPELCFV